MSDAPLAHDRLVVVSETGAGPFGTSVTVGPHQLFSDEPYGAGGRNAGPDPFELVMAGLAACTTMTLRLYADRKGWQINPLTVRVRHTQRVSLGAPRDVFHREIELPAALPNDVRTRLLAIAERCPVSRTLAAGATVESVLTEGAA